MGRPTFKDFVYEQWSPIPPLVTVDLAGKTVMVVGANTGLGFEASKHFAKMNPGRLIMACRNRAKGEAALEKLKQETGYESVELWMIDLSQFASVSGFATRFEEDGGRLDLLVENAGTNTFSYEETENGWETTLQVNNLSLSLLALLLLPRMVQTSREYGITPRIVVVGSSIHYWANIKNSALESENIWEALSSKEHCTPGAMQTRYNDSKLLNVFFVRALNDRLSQSSHGTIVNCVNPGYCYSELRRGYTGLTAIVDWIMERTLAFTSEEGSRQLVWSAVGGSGEEDKLRGAYISCSEIREPSEVVLGSDGLTLQNRLWDELAKILIGVDPRVKATIDTYLTTNNS